MSKSESRHGVDEIMIQYRTSSGILTAVSDVLFKVTRSEYFEPVDKSRCRTSTVAKTLDNALTEQRLSPDVGRVDSEATTPEDDC